VEDWLTEVQEVIKGGLVHPPHTHEHMLVLRNIQASPISL
jgi:hypothetical protein